MKKKQLYILIIGLLVGLTLGYLLANTFSSKETNEQEKTGSLGDNNLSKEEIWTCSMHPQIRQNEPGDCPLCGMDLIPLTEGSSDDPLILEMTPDAVKMSNIETTILGEQRQSDGKELRLSGKVKADERMASSQVAHVAGRIEKLYVSFTGERVSKGQKIATIYSPDLVSAQRELLEALKLRDINPQLVTAARTKLKYLKISDASIRNIEERGEIRENFTIYADASGIVTKRNVSVGDHLKEGSPLFEMVDLSKLWVLFDAYEEDLAHIEVGDRIAFTSLSAPDKIYKTRVTFIDPVINPKTRTASIRTEVNNRNGKLKPEMFVNGVLTNRPTKSLKLIVPKTAVLWTGKRSVVYVKVLEAEIPSFEYKEIEIGESLGSSYQVLSGLEVGDELVTRGSFTIDAAAQLNNQASMMNRNVTIKGNENVEVLPDYRENTPIAFQQQVQQMVSSYLEVKDALVDTNFELAAANANNVLQNFKNIEMAPLKGDAHVYWMKQSAEIKSHGELLEKATDIEEQRAQFDYLSQVMIRTVKVFGIPNDTYYVEHCPMANDNKGADWLSKEKEIRNPYFGDKMLTCGVVLDTITKDYRNDYITERMN